LAPARRARDVRLQPQRLRRRPQLGRLDAGAVQPELVERDPTGRPHQVGPGGAERIVAARIEGHAKTV